MDTCCGFSLRRNIRKRCRHLDVKSRTFIDAFNESFGIGVLPLFECLNWRSCTDGTLWDVVVIKLEAANQRISQVGPAVKSGLLQ